MLRAARSIAAFLLASLLCPGAARAASEESTVRYQVTFERTWSAETHPRNFPPLAHFSAVIGATHNARFEIIPLGRTATAGPERLCEEGRHQPLDGEIRVAIAQGAAGVLIQTADLLRSAPGQATATFEISSRHPMVSVAARIAPSPDWCAVAANVVLHENGQWFAKKTVALQAWDMGTDSAASYRDPDDDSQPRGRVLLSQSPYFVMEGARLPVGRAIFLRQ